MTAIDDRDTALLEQAPRAADGGRNWRAIRGKWLLRAVAVAAWVVRGARNPRVIHALPGYAGAVAVAAGIGGIVDYALPGIGWWVFALVAGLFALAVDRRMP